MKLLKILILIFIINGCANTLSSLSDGVNNKIPTLKNIKVIRDVSSVAFEWELLKDPMVEGFVIYRSSNDREYKEIKYIDNPLITHFVDSGLSPQSDYQYYFITVGENSYSNRSEIIRVKTSFIDSIEKVYASSNYPKKVKLIWSPHPNPSISSYLIQRQYKDEFKTIKSIDNRLLVEYFDVDLEDGVEYKYRILARDFIGNLSLPSQVVVAKTRSKPKTPILKSASNDIPNAIIISWEKENAKTYKVYRSNSKTGFYNLIGSTANNSFKDNIGESNRNFYYKVSALEESGLESDLSDAIEGLTMKSPPSPIIKAGYVDKMQAKIEWEASSGTKYFIVSKKQGVFGKVSKFKTSKTMFDDRDVKVGEDYIYSIIAIDDYGLESSPSQEVKLSIR